jgi:pimeloyl-ACP methyl ester carboxylesterase
MIVARMEQTLQLPRLRPASSSGEHHEIDRSHIVCHQPDRDCRSRLREQIGSADARPDADRGHQSRARYRGLGACARHHLGRRQHDPGRAGESAGRPAADGAHQQRTLTGSSISSAASPHGRLDLSGAALLRSWALVLWCLTVIAAAAPARADPQWLTLPPTPTLPKPERAGYAPVNGIRLWYAVFGRGEPVILLHGGLANANYWGNQVPALAKRYRVIVMDSRGHGRSTRNAEPYGYDLMADDVLGLMDFLKIRKAAIVGWSDGAILGLDIALRHPERLTKLFAFAANSNPSGVADISKSPVFNAFIARAEKEYAALSPTPTEYQAFLAQIEKMWATQPNWTEAQLQQITVPVWIVDADHDEAIKRENTEFMARAIPGAGLLIQPEVSHFSFLQDPQQFTNDVLHFLEHVKAQ